MSLTAESGPVKAERKEETISIVCEGHDELVMIPAELATDIAKVLLALGDREE